MEYINAMQRQIVHNYINNISVVEITSFDDLKKMKIGSKIVIMDNGFMVTGEIYNIEIDYIVITDNVKPIIITPNSFQYRNFLYKIL